MPRPLVIAVVLLTCASAPPIVVRPTQQPDLRRSVKAGPGASISGHVVAHGSATIRPVGLRITALASSGGEPRESSASVAVAVNADWSFRMDGLAGLYRFSAGSDRPPPLVATTRIDLDGRSYAPDTDITVTDERHDLVVYVEARPVPRPNVDTGQPLAALLDQFRNEKTFWKRFEIGKAIAARRDASVLSPLAGWLRHDDRHIRGNVAYIFARLGDPRGLQTIAHILHDRSDRPIGQGIPVVVGNGRGHSVAQVRADRYYAAHLLGDLRDPRGVALLVPLLDDPDTQWIVPWSLQQIGDRRAIAPLMAALDHDDPSMRVLVIYALEELADHRQARFGSLVTVSEAAKEAIAHLR